jgi:undecaprenol kinase/diacylglycerol kinase (ATP)
MGRQSFFYSVGNALNGIFSFFKTERNGQVQLTIALLVVIAGIYLKISNIEWLIVLLCIALVISFEMINSALEKLSDLVEPNFNPVIKIVKDVAAAAVLWSVIMSIIAGLIIFIPRIITTFH